MSVSVCLIQVPYMVGDERHGGSRGPGRLVQAGAAGRLSALGKAVSVVQVERGRPFHDSASASLAINREVAAAVRQAVAAGQFPLVLAGSCDVSLGVLAGLEHARCGVVWIDAHGDFNTPETTITGFFAGMSMAVITGHCYRTYAGLVGFDAPIPEAAVLLLGVRDLDPAERERLERSAVQVVPWQAGRPQTDVFAALDALRRQVPEVYLHIDLDGLDPEAAPGIVETPVPGGLSPAQAEMIIRAVAARFRLRAAALTTYNPEVDQDDRTLQLALRLVERLAEGAGAQGAMAE